MEMKFLEIPQGVEIPAGWKIEITPINTLPFFGQVFRGDKEIVISINPKLKYPLKIKLYHKNEPLIVENEHKLIKFLLLHEIAHLKDMDEFEADAFAEKHFSR
jgi:hypothetical protein